MQFLKKSKDEEKLKSSVGSSNEDDKKFNEPDYDEDGDQLVEKEEEETEEKRQTEFLNLSIRLKTTSICYPT